MESCAKVTIEGQDPERKVQTRATIRVSGEGGAQLQHQEAIVNISSASIASSLCAAPNYNYFCSSIANVINV